MTQAISRNHVK